MKTNPLTFERLIEIDPDLINPKLVDNKWCALRPYFTTMGLVIGITETTAQERRYCYQNPAEAFAAYEKFNDTTVHASGNWIKCKGVFNNEMIDLFNPEWTDKHDVPEITTNDIVNKLRTIRGE